MKHEAIIVESTNQLTDTEKMLRERKDVLHIFKSDRIKHHTLTSLLLKHEELKFNLSYKQRLTL